MIGSLILIPLGGLFSFFLFALSNADVMLCFTLYFILLYFIIISLGASSFLMRDRKLVGLDGKKMEINFHQKLAKF